MSMSMALEALCPYQGPWMGYVHIKGPGGVMPILRVLEVICPGGDNSISMVMMAICLYQGP